MPLAEVAMPNETLSRRQFARAVGAGLGAAMAAPAWFDLTAEAGLLPASAPEDAIQLNANENPYGPSPKALEAITRSEPVAARYPEGTRERVRDAIAQLHGLKRENVALGCGSGEILRAADAAFLGPGQRVVVAEPTFEAVLEYSRATRAEPIKVPETADFRHDLPRMAHAAHEHTGMVYVCNPNNPTGTIVRRQELESFLMRIPESTTVLVDEAYYHFVDDPEYASALEWFPKRGNIVVTRTFSKIYGLAGMRLGYAVGSPEKIAALRGYLTDQNANAAVLHAALASLADPNHALQQRKLNAETREQLCRELTKDGRRFIPSHTNFVMIEVREDVRPIIEEFRKRGILVGRKFPSLDKWLRVSIGTPQEMQTFLTAFRAIMSSRPA